MKYVILIISLLSFVTNSFSKGNKTQTSKTNAHFEIEIKTTPKMVYLNCLEGCNWREITFYNRLNRPQKLNQDGMLALEDQDTTGKFLIDWVQTAEGYQLKGVKGTVWTNLEFSCPQNNCHLTIDNLGMEAPKK